MSQLLAIPPRNPDGTFMPGIPGVVYGEQRKVLESTLRRAVAQDKAERLRNACERLLDMAANAEDDRVAMAAFSIIADRLDGKAVARIETSEGAPRDLGLAEIVALVLQHRKADAEDAAAPPHRKAEAIDAPSQHTGGGMGEGDIPMNQDEGVGG